MSVMHSSRTTAEVGVVMTIAALGREVSMAEKGGLWDSRSTSWCVVGCLSCNSVSTTPMDLVLQL